MLFFSFRFRFPPLPHVGKKRRKDDLDSDSEPNSDAEFESPMDSDPPVFDSCPSVTPDPWRPTTAGPRQWPSPVHQPRSNTDHRTNLKTAGSPVWNHRLTYSRTGCALLSSPVTKMSLLVDKCFLANKMSPRYLQRRKYRNRSPSKRPSHRLNSDTCTDQTFKMNQLLQKECNRLFVPLKTTQRENQNW